jgi:hypothetical protein
VHYRDLAHAGNAVEDFGAVHLDILRDRRRDLEQPVGLAGVILEREVDDSDLDSGRS